MNLKRYRCVSGKNGECDGGCFLTINDKLIEEGRTALFSYCPIKEHKITWKDYD